eukprot:comp21201_c0_seq1/m.28805 comp21201_c0_seq1/g.28805  ORF comp21201_c0_seq1/g.28805 comp21201_c0_seq1/m.28805 type:complete len:353 (+) comp21201_c0_seq1:732-1790(+)
MSRQCFSTRRLRAIFSPTSVHTGEARVILAKSAFTATTRPPVDREPMFTINTSFLVSFTTLACFFSPSVRTPSNLRSRKYEISSSVKICGRFPTVPSTCPTMRSARQSVGSILVPTPIRPPGTAYCRAFCSVLRVSMRDRIDLHRILLFASLDTIPGRTSISIPNLSTPCRMEPPATPPFKSSTSQPGLLTSNERITIRRGGDVKSRIGMGIRLTMYSHTHSMLYLSWAEMGTTGAPSATVPCTNLRICWYWSLAWLSLTRSILFCRMMMCLSFMISIAARCSDVCGCGHDSFPAMSSSAASITAAPFNMVAMRMSCPGQSTNDTCLMTWKFPEQPGRSQGKVSSLLLGADR